MLLSLLPLLALGATSFAHPVLEARATVGCSADNVLRHLRGANCLADSLVFCSAYLGLPAITKTVAPLPTASVTVTEFQTVVTTETLIVTNTDVVFNKLKKRCTDSTTTPTSTPISTPQCLATTSIDPSRLSSACGCLTIPPGTVTVTAGVPQITSISVTETDTVTSIVVSTTTKTITASGFVLATPTSACGCNEDEGRGVAVGDIDDDYYRLELDFNIEVYGVTSNVILSSINGLIWFDDTARGNYEFYFNDGDTNGAALPLGSDDLPDVAVLPFWSDLFINGGEVQGIWYQVTGTAGSRVITFEYIVSAWGSKANDYHFTVAFGEAGSASANKVVITYYSVLDGTQGTVAVQHDSANKAVTYYRGGSGTPISAGKTLTFDTTAGTVQAS
ncbi:hypothetical protein TWF694_003319 [Orbilia ellipsospora]|uniref:Uncharacterized protein n=1 Tax=Orbilia ellipsospora TaxID=2528407 RepID=A0AAV9X3N2_9PEZI